MPAKLSFDRGGETDRETEREAEEIARKLHLKKGLCKMLRTYLTDWLSLSRPVSRSMPNYVISSPRSGNGKSYRASLIPIRGRDATSWRWRMENCHREEQVKDGGEKREISRCFVCEIRRKDENSDRQPVDALSCG